MGTPLERFEHEYQHYNGLSADRRRRQKNALNGLSAHAGKPLIDCEASDIKAYLSAQDLHPNTVRQRLGMIRPFFEWAWEGKLIDAERLMAIQRISPPRGSEGQGLPRPYSRKELAKMREEIDAAFPHVADMWWDRWRRGNSRWKRVRPGVERLQVEAIVALALHCGLRRQEIHRAGMDDIHYDNQYVVVRYPKDFEGKADFREVPHTAHSREAVRRWIEVRVDVLRDERLTKGISPLPESPWLMLGAHESRVAEGMTFRRLHDFLGGIGSGWELHRLRHTYGTEMLRSTGRLEIVQRLMGHADPSQTLGYAKIIRDDLHAAVGKAERSFTEAVNGERAA